MQIVTSRLALALLADTDAPAMHAYRSEPDTARFQSFEPASVDVVERFIAEMASVKFDTPETWYQLGIRLRESGELIGDIGVHFVGDAPGQVELGFTIARAHQRRGFGKEAVKGVLDHLFTVLRKHRVYASVDPRNEASLALLERVGFRKEAHFRESLWFKNAWVDDVVYALLRSEWVPLT